jgi:hypothetical protein
VSSPQLEPDQQIQQIIGQARIQQDVMTQLPGTKPGAIYVPDLSVAEGGTGGGFELSPDEIDVEVKWWQSKADEINNDGRTMQVVINVIQPPAQDPASRVWFTAAIAFYVKVMTWLSDQQKYCEHEMAKYKAAKQLYLDTEEANAHQLRSQL